MIGGELVSPGCHISTRRIPKQITRREHARRPSQARDTGILGIARAIEGLFLTKNDCSSKSTSCDLEAHTTRHSRNGADATTPTEKAKTADVYLSMLIR